MSSLRSQVLGLYKRLLFMGRDWPDGYVYFRDRCKKAFINQKDLTDDEKIKECLKKGEFVIKEIEALYKLKKYRTLNKRYGSNP